MQQDIIDNQTFEFKADEKNFGGLDDFIEQFIIKHNINKNIIDNIIISTTEAVSNIIEHNYNCKGDKIISINLAYNEDKIVITIKDFGFQFDPTKFKFRRFPRSLKEIRKMHGLGIFVIRKFMDKIEYRYENGNILTLTKCLII